MGQVALKEGVAKILESIKELFGASVSLFAVTGV